MDKNQQDELDIQKNIAYTAGVLQGDITVKTLFESIAEGVVIINNIGRIILINSRFEKMSGYSKMEVMGSDLNILVNPNLHESHSEHLKRFFANPRIRPMGVGMELNVYRKDKTTVPVEISISFLDTDSGRLGIGFITDNTERKKAIDALTNRNVELNAYAHTVAHDLQSSLNGISGFSDLLLDDDAVIDKEKRKKYIEMIANSSKKMKDVIRELLLFASIDKIDLVLKRFNMKDIIIEACTRLNYQITESNATISIDDAILDCTSYSAWVEEVWLNFISNAIKYGGDAPHIKITSTKASNNFIKYTVIDQGPGIRKEDIDHLFEENKLTSLKSSKGSGLGLSIVKRIVTKLDGKVLVESVVNEGSAFSFFLKAE